MKISIISPVYNAQSIIETFVNKVFLNIENISKKYEIILIDDSSTDNSYEKLKYLSHKYQKLIISRNGKNIGQHQTIRKALKIANGDLIFILDCDMQDNPKYLKKFIQKLNNTKSTEVVVGINNSKVFKKNIFSFLFWNLLSLISLKYYDHNLTTYTLLTKKIKKKILKLKKTRFLYNDIIYVTDNVKFIKIYKNIRTVESTYSYTKCFILAFKLIIFIVLNKKK
jgi:glycosyltransferase involved in cell wall biosynthesis